MPEIKWEVTADTMPIAWFLHESDARLFAESVKPEFPDVEFKVRRYRAGRS